MNPRWLLLVCVELSGNGHIQNDFFQVWLLANLAEAKIIPSFLVTNLVFKAMNQTMVFFSLAWAVLFNFSSFVRGTVTVTVQETANGVKLTANGSITLKSSDGVTLKSNTPQNPSTSASVSTINRPGGRSQVAVVNPARQNYNTFGISPVNSLNFDCLVSGAQDTFISLPASNISTIGFNNLNELQFSGDLEETTIVGGNLMLTSARLLATDFIPGRTCFISFGNPVQRVEFVVEEIASTSPSTSPSLSPVSDREECAFDLGFIFCVIGRFIDLLLNIF